MRQIKGTVTSSKMNGTIVVTADTHKSHPKYKKRYKVSKKYYAHDPENKYQEGDAVTIYETRPLSKLKRWTVIEPVAKEATK